MHNRPDITAFIEGFSGTNRYILDYLLEEVLANQPPENQRFLLYTSILECLSAPLCDALLVVDERSQEIARQLVVSRGIVKTHTASIYRKLDVANRTEAVARARQLGILP